MEYITAPKHPPSTFIKEAMFRLTIFVVLGLGAQALNGPKTGEELVGSVLNSCGEMDCVKLNVLSYLDNVLKVEEDPRSIEVTI